MSTIPRGLLALLCMLPLSSGATVLSRVIDPLPDVAPVQPLAPGAAGVFGFVAREDPTLPPGRAKARYATDQHLQPGEYRLVSEDPSHCGPPVPEASTPWWYTVDVSGIPVGGTRACRYRVERDSLSRNDLRIIVLNPTQFNVPLSYPGLLYGGLPDLALQTELLEPVQRGATTAMVRIRVRNSSDHAVVNRPVNGECFRFGAQPFTIETDVPNGCVKTFESCGGFTPYPDRDVLTFASIPARGVAECDVRLRFDQPLTTAVNIELELYLYQLSRVRFGDGGIGLDPNRSNDFAQLGAAPFTTQIVPLSPIGSALLALLLAGIGRRAAAARSRRC